MKTIKTIVFTSLLTIFFVAGQGSLSQKDLGAEMAPAKLKSRLSKRKKPIKKRKSAPYASRRAIPSGADKIGKGEHSTAIKGLPIDTFGLVDWVQSVKQMKIAPYNPPGRADKFYEGTVIFNALNPEWGDVIFDHDLHTFHVDCDSCHPEPFKKTPGKARVYMILIKQGKLCGKCHGKIAFPIENCERCHVLPKSNIKW